MRRIHYLLLLFITIITFLIIPCVAICYTAENTMDWTEAEINFITAHPVIHLAVDPKFIPFEFFDED